MSALLAPQVTIEARTQARAIPYPRYLPRTRTRSRTIAKPISTAARFGMIGAVAFMASSIGGFVMLERARAEAVASTRRADVARHQAGLLSNQVNELANEQRVADWAAQNGFVASR